MIGCNGWYPSIRAGSGSNDDITAIQGRKEITATSAIIESQSPKCPSSFRSGYYSLPKGRTVAYPIPESIKRMKVPSPLLPFLTTHLFWILTIKFHSFPSSHASHLSLLGGEERGERRGDSLLSAKTMQVGNKMGKKKPPNYE